MMTLIAPNGVTKIAGAKVYAAKLATARQPSVLVLPRVYHTFPNDHYISACTLTCHRERRRTSNHPSPPNWIP
jgi:hypothetical protein